MSYLFELCERGRMDVKSEGFEGFEEFEEFEGSEELPFEIWLSILAFLDFVDIIRCTRVSRLFYNAGRDALKERCVSGVRRMDVKKLTVHVTYPFTLKKPTKNIVMYHPYSFPLKRRTIKLYALKHLFPDWTWDTWDSPDNIFDVYQLIYYCGTMGCFHMGDTVKLREQNYLDKQVWSAKAYQTDYKRSEECTRCVSLLSSTEDTLLILPLIERKVGEV